MAMNSTKMKFAEQVNIWLSDKPFDWKKIIYTRSALRALPTMAKTEENWLKFYSVSLFQANLVAWMSLDASNLKFHTPAELARNALQEALRRAYDDGFAAPAIFGAMSAVVSAQGASSEHLFEWEKNSESGNSCDEGIRVDLMSYVEKDCDWMVLEEDPKARDLIWISLWMRQHPEARLQEWRLLKESLLKADPNYNVWIDWYERRIRGERAAFDIPGDKGRIEDKKILRRLAEATDEDFWGKGYEYVNATLKGWLDEARERVAPKQVHHLQASNANTGPPEAGTATLGIVRNAVDAGRLPPQDSGATAYGVNEQGKLDRLPNSDQVHLRDMPDQRRAYDDLREAAAELLAEGQRLGHRLKRALDRFLDSLPDGFEDAEAYLVWRDANTLRRLHRAHREASKSTEPDEAKLEPVVAEGLGGLLDLYNNFAFADNGLRAKDEARIAPQERARAEAEATAAIPLVQAILANHEIATPEALDDIVADLENAELPAHDAYADQVLDQSNRTTRNIVAGLISDTWAAFKSTGLMGQAIAGGAAWDGIKLTATIIGGIDYAPLMQFIATNPGLLQHYVAVAFPTFEHLSELIERIRLCWLTRSKD